MGTGITWTDETWNPTIGCMAVSPGCDRCYAATMAHTRLAKDPNYRGLTFADGRFNGTVRTLPDRLEKPLRWRSPRRIFVDSMSDLFHDDVPDDYIAAVFSVMASAPRHTFQVLTKRHARMRSLLNSPEWPEMLTDCLYWPKVDLDPERPLDNVWLGVSVENQKWADIRVPVLLDTPAAIRFVSAEPLLGPVDLTDCDGVNALERDWIGSAAGGTGAPHPLLDWVIVGGESGPGARRMDVDWMRAIVDDCTQAQVAVMVKQLGTVTGGPHHHDIETFPEDLRRREYPAA